MGTDAGLLAQAFDSKVPDRQTSDGQGSAGALHKVPWQDVARNLSFPEPVAIGSFERAAMNSVHTLSSQYDCVICDHCARPVLADLIDKHQTACEKRRSENKKPSSGNTEAPVQKTKAATPSVKIEPQAPAEKPAVHTESAEKQSESRKRKSERDPAAAKRKRPAKVQRSRDQQFSPDKNCGVPLPNGNVCMRSLTCKAHSMSAKRAVPGRTAPYDVLLASYQRQNQVKNAALMASREMEAEKAAETVNPEKEVQQVLDGVRRGYCAPLDKRVIVSARSRARRFRLREMLALALLPKGLTPAGDAIFGRSLAFRPERPEVLHYVRAPAVQRAMYLASLQQQQQQQQQRQQLHQRGPK